MRKFVFILLLMFVAINSTSCNQIRPNYNSDELDTKKIRSYYSEEKFDEAEKLVDEYLKKNPESTLALSEKSYILISKGKNEEALIIIDRLLAKEPDDDALLNNKSWAYYNLRLYNLTLEYANRAIAIEPNCEFEFTNKGNALYGLGKYNEAIKQFTIALEYNRDASIPYHGMGLCYLKKKDNKKAFSNFKKAFNIKPHDDDYFVELVDVCNELKNYGSIIDYCNKRIGLSAKDSIAYYRKAEAYFNLKKYSLALKNYEESIKPSEYNADAYYGICKTYLKLKSKEKAYQYLKKALNDDSDYIYYLDKNELKDLKGYKNMDQLVFRQLSMYNMKGMCG